MLRVWVQVVLILGFSSPFALAEPLKPDALTDQTVVAQRLAQLAHGDTPEDRTNAEVFRSIYGPPVTIADQLQQADRQESFLLKGISSLSLLEGNKSIPAQSQARALKMLRVIEHGLRILSIREHAALIQKTLAEMGPGKRKLFFFKTKAGKLYEQNYHHSVELLHEIRQAERVLSQIGALFFQSNPHLPPIPLRQLASYLMERHFPCTAWLDNTQLN